MRSSCGAIAERTVPGFTGAVTVAVHVPCTFDFNVAAAKYFHAVSNGGIDTANDVPLCFQFSGTAFYSDADGPLQIGQIGWDKEARFRLPAHVWRDMMDHYYPNSTWLRLGRDAFERLYEFKRRQGLATWEETIEHLLPDGEGARLVNFAPVEKIANAVLYEGFLLYPYRKSAVKNQQRWHFGTLGPAGGSYPVEMQTECLVESSKGSAVVDIKIRFLQDEIERDVTLRAIPVPAASRIERSHFRPSPQALPSNPPRCPRACSASPSTSAISANSRTTPRACRPRIRCWPFTMAPSCPSSILRRPIAPPPQPAKTSAHGPCSPAPKASTP